MKNMRTGNIRKKILSLAYFGVFYNLAEGIISVYLGHGYNSISLVGFGLDSFIESVSSIILIIHHGIINSGEEKDEAKAAKAIGATLFIVAIYTLWESVERLINNNLPDRNLFGFVITLVSVFVMVYIYKAKYELGKKYKVKTLIADSKQTLACIYLSVSVLAGLFLYNFLGIWWADSAAGVVVSVFLFVEGYKTFLES